MHSSISTMNAHTSLADCCPLGLHMLQSKLSGFTSELDATGQQMEVAWRKQCTEHLSLTNTPVLQKPTLACVAEQAIWLLIQGRGYWADGGGMQCHTEQARHYVLTSTPVPQNPRLACAAEQAVWLLI